MLKVKIPSACQSEQCYALDILLGEFLGLVFDVETYDGEVIEITRPDGAGKLTLDASFFHKAHQAWLKSESMPVLPLENWTPANDGIEATLVESSVPVLYGQPGLVKTENHIHLNLDIFGSAFFMLSRYEELITADQDNHDRFPAWASVAYKAHFLDRPIVNEYLEILWSSMQILWPDLQRKQRNASSFITCDTDWPFDPTIYSFKRMVKSCGRQVLKELSLLQALQTLSKYVMYKIGIQVRDEYRENISWMMDVNEQAGNKVAFYFITHKTSVLDTDENFDSPKMRVLFKGIYQRGHEIGLHPGYKTFNNNESFVKSVQKLKKIFKEENIQQALIGGRMHFFALGYSANTSSVGAKWTGL